jgi:hypothetical protein
MGFGISVAFSWFITEGGSIDSNTISIFKVHGHSFTTEGSLSLML